MQPDISIRAGRRRRIFVAQAGDGQRLQITAKTTDGSPVSGTIEHSSKGTLGFAAKVDRIPLQARNRIKLDRNSRDIVVSVIPDRNVKVSYEIDQPSVKRSVLSAFTGASLALSAAMVVLLILGRELI